MKIAIMGSGGVGGYFGARLAAAGHEVTFIARGAHLAAIQSAGLVVQSPLGNLHLAPAKAVAEAREAPMPDAVIFAVKMGDTERAATSLRPLMGKDTPVFTFQNGVEASEIIEKCLGPGHVVPGVARIAAHIAKPGIIEHANQLADLEFGESDNRPSERSAALLAACKAAGISARISADVVRALWMKFALLAPMSGVTTLTQRPAGAIRSHPETRALLEAAVGEVVAVGAAAGGRLTAADRDAILKSIDALPEAMTTSMAHDRAAGKPLEMPWLSGAVVRLGQRYGIPTPTHRFITQALALEVPGRST
jgi:2-dehydropantoate 2-reductase